MLDNGKCERSVFADNVFVRVVLFDYNTKILWLDYFKCECCVV